MWLLELFGWSALGAFFGATSAFLHGRESLPPGGRSRLLTIGMTGGFVGGLVGRAGFDNGTVAMLCAGAGAMFALAVFDRGESPTRGRPAR